jgi:hypothetical protein
VADDQKLRTLNSPRWRLLKHVPCSDNARRIARLDGAMNPYESPTHCEAVEPFDWQPFKNIAWLAFLIAILPIVFPYAIVDAVRYARRENCSAWELVLATCYLTGIAAVGWYAMVVVALERFA